MATYTELHALKNDSALKNRVLVACIVAAEAIMEEVAGTDNHANRLLWAASVFANPTRELDRMYWAVLAANASQDVATIQGASDVAIQANVDAHVDLFATG